MISDPNQFSVTIFNAQKMLQKAKTKWIRDRGPKYRYGIKDNHNFTKFLITFIRGGNTDKIEYESEQTLELRGRIIKCRTDRNGFNYGFIQRTPNDVFFHERDNDNLDFNEIYGKTVIYHIFTDSVNGEDRAKIIEVLSE